MFTYRNSNFKTDTYYRNENFKEKLYAAKKAGYSVFVNTVRLLNNCKQARKNNGDIWIQEIFSNHFDEFLELNKDKNIRPAIISNVRKMIDCQNLDKGFQYFECPHCNNFYIVGHSCKSRFCPRCGKKARDKQAINICKKLYKIPHRQLVFSVPFDLRKYFRIHRELLSVLFPTVNEIFIRFVKSKAKNLYKKEKRKIGMVCFLHTFGRDLKWHPHIHVLFAERLLVNNSTFKRFDYLPYEYFRKSFLFQLITNMKKYYKTNVSDIKEYYELCSTVKNVLKNYKNGSYFYGRNNDKDFSMSSAKSIAKYISRYASHPAISERRILKYDKENKMVTWYYDPHEDDNKEEGEERLGRQIITESVFKFIERLIIHIPDNNFKLIHYYGFYANAAKKIDNAKLFSKKEIEKMLNNTLWKKGLIDSFGYNPLLCCYCGNEMILNPEFCYSGGT